MIFKLRGSRAKLQAKPVLLPLHFLFELVASRIVVQAASRLAGAWSATPPLGFRVKAKPANATSVSESDRLALVNAFPQDLVLPPWESLDTFNHAVAHVLPHPRVRL